MSELNVRIKPKKSSTAGEIPANTELEVAEIAVNTADGRLFTKHTDNSIVEIGGAAGGGITEIVQDGSPQLGGDLDVNGYTISSAAGGDVTIAPNTTGDVVLRGKGVSGASTVKFNTESNNQYVQIAAPTNADLSGSYTLRLPTTPGLAGQTLITDGTGALSWAASIGNSVEGLNDVEIPETGALAEQVLKYNGAGLWVNGYVSYNELTDTPTFGSAAFADTSDFATAAQGALAASALQPGNNVSELVNDAGYVPASSLADVATSGDYNDLINTPTVPDLSAASIGDLSDVDTTTTPPSNDQALVWNGTTWVPGDVASGGGGGGGGASGTRVTTTVNTDAAGKTILEAIGTSGRITAIESPVDAWVTLYVDAASRDADAGRSFSTDPSPGSGILGDALLLAGQKYLMTPDLAYWNNDTPAAPAVYVLSRTQGGAAVAGALTFEAYPASTLDRTEVQTSDVDGVANFTGLGASGTLVSVSSSVDAWISFYTTDAARTADNNRSFSEDPTAGSGLLADFYILAGTSALPTPAVSYFNGDEDASQVVYVKTRAQDGTAIAAEITVRAFRDGVGTGGISTALLQSVVAASTDFADFQNRIAAL